MAHMTRFTLLLGLAACTSTSSTTPQTITGTVDQTTFASPVDRVRVLQGTTEVASASVGADGAFAIAIPAGTGYRIELTNASLVFPRATGTIDTSFAIVNGTRPFSLGTVRYVGDAKTHAYHQDSSDGECEDGIDESGNVCVDDPSDQGAACEDGTNDGETNDDGSNDGETTDDGGTSQSAVADHNIPSSLGCDDQADGETSD